MPERACRSVRVFDGYLIKNHVDLFRSHQRYRNLRPGRVEHSAFEAINVVPDKRVAEEIPSCSFFVDAFDKAGRIGLIRINRFTQECDSICIKQLSQAHDSVPLIRSQLLLQKWHGVGGSAWIN